MAFTDTFLTDKRVKKTNLNQIAVVSGLFEDVRRKFSDDLSWFKLEVSDEIYESDSIFTGPSSDAEITFDNGTKLFIDSSSLITLKVENEESFIDVKKGSLSSKLKKGHQLQIKIKDKVQQLAGDDSHVNLSLDQTGSSSITILDGNVELKAGNQVSLLSKNQIANIGKEGKLGEIQDIKINLSYPKAESRIYKLKEDRSMTFKWNNLVSLVQNEIIIALDKEFQKIVFSRLTNESSITLQQLPFSQSLFWKVIGKDESDKIFISNTYRFKIYQETPPLLVSPSQNSIVTNKRTGQKSIPITFDWEDKSGGKSYKIQIATDLEFNNIIQEKSVVRSYLLSDPLAAQIYYWRVKIDEIERPQSIWSEIYKFELKRELTQKEKSILELLRLQTLAPPVLKTENKILEDLTVPYLIWDASSEIKNFKIQIDTTNEFKNPIIDLDQQENFYLAKKLDPGLYFWRVSGIDSQGNIIKYSQTSQFEVYKQLDPPKIDIDKNITLINPGQSVSLIWNIVDQASSYLLEISQDPFYNDKIVEKELIANSFEMAMNNPGFYYWRVRAKGNKGQVGSFSKNIKIKVKPYLDTPKTSQKKLAFNIKEGATIRWESVDKAHHYDIEIATSKSLLQEKRISDQEKLVIKVSTEKLEYFFNSGHTGDYYWRVKAIREDGKSGHFGPIGLFSLVKGLQGPKLNLMTKPIALNTSAELAWEEVKDGHSYEIWINKSSTFENQQKDGITKVATDNELEIAFNSPGLYFWKVRAKDHNQINGDFSQISTFSVGQILPPPDLFEDQRYFSTQQNIKLKWYQNDLASSYKVELATNENFDKYTTKSTKSNSLNLGKLTEGRYWWRIIAYDQFQMPGQSTEIKYFDVRPQLPGPTGLAEQGINRKILSWENVEAAKFYILELSQDKEFSKVTKKFKTVSSSFILRGLKAGDYYWRVYAYDQANVQGDSSEVSTVSLSAAAGLLGCLKPSQWKNADLEDLVIDQKSGCVQLKKHE